MDPVSLTVSVTSLITVCFQTIQTCRDIVTKYEDAPRIVTAIQAESNTTRETLAQIFLFTTNESEGLKHLSSGKIPLAEYFEISITACTVTYSALDNELQKIMKNKEGSSLKFRERAQYMWAEDTLKDLLEELRGQRDALGSLILILQSRSIAEVLALLKSKDEVFQTVKRRTSSLHAIRQSSRRNYTNDWGSLDTYSVFSEDTDEEHSDYENEIFRSGPYRRVNGALRDARYGKSRRRKILEPKLDLLSESDDLIDLRDHPALLTSYTEELQQALTENDTSQTYMHQSTQQVVDSVDTHRPEEGHARESDLQTNSALDETPAAQSSPPPASPGTSSVSHTENVLPMPGVYGSGSADDNILVPAPSADARLEALSETSGHQNGNEESETGTMGSNRLSGDLDNGHSPVTVNDQKGEFASVTMISSKSDDFNVIRQSSARGEMTNHHSNTIAGDFALKEDSEEFKSDKNLLNSALISGRPIDMGMFVQFAVSGDAESVRKALPQMKDTRYQPIIHLATTAACFHGHLEVVELLLLTLSDVNAVSKRCVKIRGYLFFDLTALHFASAGDHVPVIELLVRSGADLEALDSNGWSPKHLAAATGRTKALRALLDALSNTSTSSTSSTSPRSYNHRRSRRPNISRPNSLPPFLQGCTPTYLAAFFGAVDACNLLLNANSSLAKTRAGANLIHAAIGERNDSSVAIIKLTTSPYLNTERFLRFSQELHKKKPTKPTTIHESKELSASRLDLIKRLHLQGINSLQPDNNGLEPLHLACLRRDEAMIRYFISACGANPLNTTGNGVPVLHFAAFHTDLRVLDIIFSELESTDNSVALRDRCFTQMGKSLAVTPLIFALTAGKPDCAAAIVRQTSTIMTCRLGAKIDGGYSDLGTHYDILDWALLIDPGWFIPFSTQGSLRRSPSLLSDLGIPDYSRDGHLTLTQLADVNARDDRGDTVLTRCLNEGFPIHFYNSKEFIKGIRLLGKLGYDINNVHTDGRPIFRFLKPQMLEVGKCLVEAGANIEAKDTAGETTLHWAARRGTPAFLELMINLGADFMAKTSAGKDAWKLVAERPVDGIFSRIGWAVDFKSLSELKDEDGKKKKQMKKMLDAAKAAKAAKANRSTAGTN